MRSIYSGFMKEPYEIIECEFCTYRRTSPKPTEFELSEIYSTTYAYGVHAALYGELRARAKHIAKLIDSARNREFQIVELGCGSGILLEEMARRKGNIYGIEISKEMVQLARSRLAKYGYSDNIKLGSATSLLGSNFAVGFDLVMNHSLEHFIEPSQLICDLAKLMTSGSNLFLVVPNSRTIFGKPRNRWWGYWQVPIHVSHYSKQSLDELLRHNGFEMVNSFSLGSSLTARFLTFVNLFKINVKTEGTGLFRIFSFFATLYGKTYRFGTGELMVHAKKI